MRVFTVSEIFGNSRVKLYGRAENIYHEPMFLPALWLCHFNLLNTTSSLTKQTKFRDATNRVPVN